MTRTVPWILASIFLSACHSGEESPQTLVLKLGHVGAPGSLFAASAEELARRANEQLAGRVEIQVFGSSQLGNDEVLLQKLKLGTVDLALPSTIMSSQVDELGIFEMPYLVRDREHMKRIEEEMFWPRLAPLVEERDLEVLAVWENGFRHVTNNVRPIRVPADLQGIKLRTPRGRWRVRMFLSYGANPTPMALSEVFVALQTGVMDGQENPFAQIWSLRFHEVQKYLSLTSHVYTPAYLTVGTHQWRRLPLDVRQTLEATARETQEHVYATAVAMEQDLLGKLRGSGISINEVDRERFVEASAGIYAEFSERVASGGELIAAVRALDDS